MDLRGMARAARSQHGLVTRSQALEYLTQRQLERRVRDGGLERVRPGVYRLAGSPLTWEQQVLAACLSGSADASASHATAARLLGLKGFESANDVEAIEITTPSRTRTRLSGVAVHDTAVRGPSHFTRKSRIPSTSVARTLCDLTWHSQPWQVERALDDALRRQLTSLRLVTRVFRDLAHRGRRKSTVMRALLEARLPGYESGESPMEDRLLRWILDAGLPPPTQQHRVRIGGTSYRLDLAYPEFSIGIEYDGWDVHKPRSAFDADRKRQNAFETRDWMILRYTSASSRELVVAEVAQAISVRSKSLLPASM